MTRKTFEFLSSFGLMLFGVILLFSASIIYPTVSQKVSFLPKSNPRIEVFAGGDEPKVLPMSKPKVPLKKDNSEFLQNITAISVIAIDDKTNTVLYTKNEQEVRPLASVTKLMSALTLLDVSVNWKQKIQITDEDFETGSHFVKVGEVYSAEDMWHLSLVGSSNSAVNALVRASGISKEDFVKLMNNKAQEMRLRTAKFTEPTGLDVQNVASAEDTARILREALRRDKIFNTLQIAEYYAQPEGQKPKRVWSTNWLLTHWVPSGYDELSIAGKTGYIVDSKYNFAVRLEGKNGHAIRVVVMGSENNESRFSEARDVADWVFEHYLWPDEDGYLNLAE